MDALQSPSGPCGPSGGCSLSGCSAVTANTCGVGGLSQIFFPSLNSMDGVQPSLTGRCGVSFHFKHNCTGFFQQERPVFDWVNLRSLTGAGAAWRSPPAGRALFRPPGPKPSCPLAGAHPNGRGGAKAAPAATAALAHAPRGSRGRAGGDFMRPSARPPPGLPPAPRRPLRQEPGAYGPTLTPCLLPPQGVASGPLARGSRRYPGAPGAGGKRAGGRAGPVGAAARAGKSGAPRRAPRLPRAPCP